MSNPVAIIDYGLGNVFSILKACERVGIRAQLTATKEEILNSPAVILPGVGAFGDAMATLNNLDLVSVLKDFVHQGKPLMGVCLGLQLLMEESHEFGLHKGLGIIKGDVVKLNLEKKENRILKVPEVCWNKVNKPAGKENAWDQTPLKDFSNGEYMYFVHSFYVRPKEKDVVLSHTQYGETEFCSSVK
ncbi:MAG: imidazole glycerol phosphate synthase subunit HisH, partial [Elusimicrobiota bacterium]